MPAIVFPRSGVVRSTRRSIRPPSTVAFPSWTQRVRGARGSHGFVMVVESSPKAPGSNASTTDSVGLAVGRTGEVVGLAVGRVKGVGRGVGWGVAVAARTAGEVV